MGWPSTSNAGSWNVAVLLASVWTSGRSSRKGLLFPLSNVLLSATVIIGLVAIAVAVLERGYKTFLEKKVIDPKLQFNSAYLINILITSGTMVAIVTGVLPLVLNEISAQPNIPLTLGSAALIFVLGYSTTYRFLDGLNNSTEKKLEVQELREEVAEQ